MSLLFGYILSSSNSFKILLVLPENESQQQRVVYSLVDSVVCGQKKNYEESSFDITYNRAKGYRRENYISAHCDLAPAY
jgi:hypothetical protein